MELFSGMESLHEKESGWFIYLDILLPDRNPEQGSTRFPVE